MEPKHRARALMMLTEAMQPSTGELIPIRQALGPAMTAVLLATPLEAIRAMPPEVRREIGEHIDNYMRGSDAVKLAQKWHPGRRFDAGEKEMIKRHLVPLVTGGAGGESHSPSTSGPRRDAALKGYAGLVHEALRRFDVPSDNANWVMHRMAAAFIPIVMSSSVDQVRDLVAKGNGYAIDDAIQGMKGSQLKRLSQKWAPGEPVETNDYGPNALSERDIQLRLRAFVESKTTPPIQIPGGRGRYAHAVKDALAVVDLPPDMLAVAEKQAKQAADVVVEMMPPEQVRALVAAGHGEAVDAIMGGMGLAELRALHRRWKPGVPTPRDLSADALRENLGALVKGPTVAPTPEQAPAPRRRRREEPPAPTGDRTAPYSYTRQDGKVVTVAQGRKKPVRKAAETPENYLWRLMRWHLSR